MSESANILIGKIASQLMIEAENLRAAAVKQDVQQVEEIILRKEHLFQQLKSLLKEVKKPTPPTRN